MVILTSPSDFGGGGLMGAGYIDGRAFANRQCLPVWLLCQGLQDVNFQIDGLAIQLGLHHWPGTQAWRL